MASVLMVVTNPNSLAPEDTSTQARLVALGHTVTLVDDDSAAPSNVLTYGLIVLGPSAGQAQTATKYRNIAVPLLSFALWRTANTSMTANSTSGVGSQTTITITDGSHPLAAGFAAGPVVIASSTSVGYIDAATDAHISQVAIAANTRATIFAIDAGVTMAGAVVAPARRVGFGPVTVGNLNAAGLALFDAAVSWLIGGRARVAAAQRPGTAPMPSPLPRYDRENEAQFRAGVERALMDVTGAVTSNDSRLTDARTPTAHASTHYSGGADPLTLASLVGDLPVARVTSAVATTDPRLSDARTPTAHAASHHSGGTDALTLASIAGNLPVARVTDAVATSDSRLSDARTPVAHNQTAATISDLTEVVQDMVATMLAAGANVSVSYNDTTGVLTVSASVPAHASSHEAGGSDDLAGGYYEMEQLTVGDLSVTGSFEPVSVVTEYAAVNGPLLHGGSQLAFFNLGTGVTKATVTGSRGGNAAVASLMSALAGYGLITNSTSA